MRWYSSNESPIKPLLGVIGFSTALHHADAHPGTGKVSLMFTLDQVVPWGRSFGEYRRMFALSASDLRKHILGCADGPASFNAELNAMGGTVTSCDPLYGYSADEIRQRIADTSPEIIEQARMNRDEFIWSESLPDVEALAQHRLATMECFLRDYELGRKDGRYLPAELPNLPFDEATFDLAVCSHFLFLYSEQLSEQFHLDSIRNLIRVAEEVRIFPLLELGSVPSRHVESVTAALREEERQVTIETVDYEFQRGGNQMMRVCRFSESVPETCHAADI